LSLSGYGQVSNDEGEGGAAIRERILAGVDRLFYAQGIKSVGVDAIAATLGISKKTLYRHFPSKDDLVIGYLRGRFRPLPEAFTKPPVEQIPANLEWIARSLTSARDFRGCAFLNALAELGSEDSEGVDWPLLTSTGGGCGTVTCCPSATSVT
jgi:AcrR family transcriptional regulator